MYVGKGVANEVVTKEFSFRNTLLHTPLAISSLRKLQRAYEGKYCNILHTDYQATATFRRSVMGLKREK